MTAEQIVSAIQHADSHNSQRVIITGGEPTMQWDATLAVQLKQAGFIIHMESNGTHELDADVDWLTVSPKPQFHGPKQELRDLSPNECKVVVDESAASPDEFGAHLDQLRSRYPNCKNWFLQPCDGEGYQDSLQRTLEFVAAKPDWRLSLQLHKLVGVP